MASELHLVRPAATRGKDSGRPESGEGVAAVASARTPANDPGMHAEGETMPLSSISESTTVQRQGAKPPALATGQDFSALLQAQQAEQQQAANPAPAAGSESADSQQVILGTLDAAHPTISHLLADHPVYDKDKWNILHSPENRDKHYTRIKDGSVVTLDRNTLALGWSRPAAVKPQGVEPTPIAGAPPPADLAGAPPELVHLGNLSAAQPSVSQLLRNHPVYGKECWQILKADVNSQKNYASIRRGTGISLNPQTQELVWEQGKNPVVALARPGAPPPHPTFRAAVAAEEAVNPTLAGSAGAMPPAPTEPDPFSANLAEGVKPHIGKSYQRYNCYNLVVQGLKEQGVKYLGQGGLEAKLEETARAEGKASNSYLNGEGLVKVGGTEVFHQNISAVHDPKNEAKKLYAAMEPYLQKGYVLSFSTPTRGHTGIVSRKGEDWTYINSGRLDHNTETSRVRKGVGEEYLQGELENWCTMAARRKESLQVTMGRMLEEKLVVQPPAAGAPDERMANKQRDKGVSGTPVNWRPTYSN